ncbi:Hypothetical protein PFR_JS20-2_514 [Propionibacterium freudenreichii]|nr:Hypothetical protein PFR_JS20-1_514 [Propionibacterium freudenreichii]SCQ80009.1 Hypothetical protein PFR_JS20-2_514 [Propionibacterium freudenreichii]
MLRGAAERAGQAVAGASQGRGGRTCEGQGAEGSDVAAASVCLVIQPKACARRGVSRMRPE